jgi:deoxyribonuclease V
MKIPELHRWDLTPKEAVALQKELAGRVDVTTPLGSFTTVAGADISYNRYSPVFYACVVVLKLPDLTVVEERTAVRESTFPYVPGLLSFREAPALLDAFRQLRRKPDVVMIDGQGYAHPRRIGIASHVGLWLGLPTVGCAKTRLAGDFDEPGPAPGEWSPLVNRDEVIGAALRNKARTAPLFVSPGHHCDLKGAIEAVRVTTRCRRIPEPTRLAHERVNAFRRRSQAGGGHE